MVQPNIGDFFVVRTTGIAARCIQVGTWSKWNHAGIYIGNNQIIEATPHGVQINYLYKYNHDEIMWSTGIEPPFTEAEAEELVKFLKTFVGDPYGFWSIVGIGFKCLGISLLPAIRRAENEKQVICSQLVAWGWSHMHRKLSDKQHALTTPKILAQKLSRDGTTP